MSPSDRSVWGATTDEFKRQHRAYLLELASTDHGYRSELIGRLEWCLDRWNHWREKFYPETSAPLLFPFFQSAKGGSEFGHYSVCGSSGQPSAIHIRRDYLLGERDITLVTLGKTQRLVLKKDHPRRSEVVDMTILHELVHQYLHEGADVATRATYEGTESKKKGGYKGHGPLFTAEVNRISQILQPELGFEFAPMRHSKRSHATRGDEDRFSCSAFGARGLFFAWDPDQDLTPEQLEENEARMKQGLVHFDGAIELVTVEKEADTDFPAPYGPDCADTCLQMLQARDGGTPGLLVHEFHLATLRDMQKAGVVGDYLEAIGYGGLFEAGVADTVAAPAVPSDIPPPETADTPVPPPELTVSPAGGTEPEWQVRLLELHGAEVALRPAVAWVISRCFDGQKPDRSVRFPSFVAALYGVTREAIRLAVNAALLEPDQLAA